jgi:signal transduction histidine kinase
MLGIQRTGDQELAIGPQPGLASLPALGEQMRQAGLPVTVRVEGEQVALPAGIDLSAFRIVQEALTNTLKHAGPVPVEVVMHYNASTLELVVLDEGQDTISRDNGSGHGLVGMRERVGLYGGTLETGRRDGGGFAVRVRLPLRGARA